MKTWEKKVILDKIEGVYGVDSVPIAANAIIARNYTFNPNPTQGLARGLVDGKLGNVREPQALRRVDFSFDVELAGSGTVDVPPAYGVHLRAAGFAETINAATDVQYDPVSASYESMSHYHFEDGTRHQVAGVRGSPSLVFQPNEIPLLRFAFQGLHVDPTDTANVVGDFTAFKEPKEVSKDNTPTFTLHGYAAVLRSLEINLNTAVTFRDLVNSKSVEMGARDPRGTVVIEAPPLATKDFFAIAKAETLGAIQLIHGSVAGDIVQVDCPKVQLINPRYTEVDGNTYLEMDLNVAENAGDDEIKITVK